MGTSSEHNYYKFCLKQKLWYQEACMEIGRRFDKIDDSYTIYPRRFWDSINTETEKTIDFCFIGSYKINKTVIRARRWVIEFVNRHFNKNSYLQFTDGRTKKHYIPMGVYDYTLKEPGFFPKKLWNYGKKYREANINMFDSHYFDTMSKSKFCLCPAGDAEWSMRFYESLLCKCIPIVLSSDHTYRSFEEQQLTYNYIVYDPDRVDYQYNIEDANSNYELFIKHHTFKRV